MPATPYLPLSCLIIWISWKPQGGNSACLVAFIHHAHSLTCKLQVGSILQQLLLHAAECLHYHLLHLFLFAVSDGHEGGEEFTLFLTGVLQPAWRYLQVPLHVKGLHGSETERTKVCWWFFRDILGQSRQRLSSSCSDNNCHMIMKQYNNHRWTDEQR